MQSSLSLCNQMRKKMSAHLVALLSFIAVFIIPSNCQECGPNSYCVPATRCRIARRQLPIRECENPYHLKRSSLCCLKIPRDVPLVIVPTNNPDIGEVTEEELLDETDPPEVTVVTNTDVDATEEDVTEEDVMEEDVTEEDVTEEVVIEEVTSPSTEFFEPTVGRGLIEEITEEPVITAPSFMNEPNCGISRNESNRGGPVFIGRTVTRGLGKVDSQPGDWPWMALIENRNREGKMEPICSGFFIDRIHVLTAAHCLPSRNPSSYIIRVGNVDFRQAEAYEVSDIAVPEGYVQGFYYNDIALLTLTRAASVVPVCLPDVEMAAKNLNRLTVTVAGWGSTDIPGPMSATLKHMNGMMIMDNANCEAEFRTNAPRGFQQNFPAGLNQDLMCAGFLGDKQLGTCTGDGGGPMMHKEEGRWYAIGIVSFGYGCGEGTPEGFTRMSSYMNWLGEVLNSE